MMPPLVTPPTILGDHGLGHGVDEVQLYVRQFPQTQPVTIHRHAEITQVNRLLGHSDRRADVNNSLGEDFSQ